MHFILSTLSTLSTVSAQSWLRRAYFDDTRCAGSMSVGISVPATYSCSQTTPLINTCEVKGQDPYKTGDLKSSEATGCTPRNGPVSDAAWVPSANEGRLSPGASYMTVNAYVDTSCTPSALSEQNIFLADGRCYAVEFEKSFFRATCEGNAGTLSVFTDPLCQSCDGGHLFAGMYQGTCIFYPSYVYQWK